MNRSPLILSIETATRAGSVAVTRGVERLSCRGGDAEISHSAHLLDHINDALDEAGVKLDEVDLFAAAAGPGSFTGLRIGLATTKSFAATLGRGCVGVPTLYAVAHAAGESRRTIALLPAGRGEVFAQALRVGRGGEVHTLEVATHIRPERLMERVGAADTPLRWAGEGARLHAEAIEARALALDIRFASEAEEEQSGVGELGGWTLAASQPALATAVGALALGCYERGEVVSPERLSAIYLRPSDAELNEQG